MKMKRLFTAVIFFLCSQAYAQPVELDQYNPVWTSQSRNSSESMPCGGGDIGVNVWVENGDLLFYVSRSGAFDENNALLKSGRIRVRLSPNPFMGETFKQELLLREGYVSIKGSQDNLSGEAKIWVDVFKPAVHVEIKSNRPTTAEAYYESWRYEERQVKGRANNANSYKWAPDKAPGGKVVANKDDIAFLNEGVIFYHRNKGLTVFDAAVKQQGMEPVKDQMFNPLKDLTFGGMMIGDAMDTAGTVNGLYADTAFKGWKLQSRTASRSHAVRLFLHSAQAPSLDDWMLGLEKIAQSAKQQKNAFAKTVDWWRNYWKRSFIIINPGAGENSPEWRVGRNYQLFRYMLGCNAFGSYPTKFNGGLFTYDPRFVDSTMHFTPDHRNWGGGTHTAQNQRLVYFPMIKSGDFDMMKPQFDFYMRNLRNAELRSEFYWGHKGACFTEQLENFGLPNPAEYGWDRPAWYDKGMQYNAWLEYQWDTVLEFCLMILENERYAGANISEYMPLIESSLTFFDEHYQYLAKQRGRRIFDENGHLVLYPGSACETYKMAYNATPTIAALQVILERILKLPVKYATQEKKEAWKTMLSRIPPISFRECEGMLTIAPARLWERINNQETAQLYPVFPWAIYGVGKPGLDTAINTYLNDPDAIRFRSHVGWKQDNIFAARLGLTDEASRLTLLKLDDSERRFPAFWGPGFDWTPDHNWGGSGMIGLQEMLLQTDGDKIYVFPAWPMEWDVHFKLHAPNQTVVEGIIKNGKVEKLATTPSSRMKDIIRLGADH